MKAWLRRWWPAFRVLLVLAILGSVGWRLARDLGELELGELSLRPGWLAVCGLLYVTGLGGSGFFWFRLLRVFDQQPAPLATARAYYLGHLGKYLPGKAWALLLRGTTVRGPGVGLGPAIITAFYEVLTTMAAGALLAAVLFACQPPAAVGLTWDPVLVGVLLLALVGVPLLPAVFNRLVGRLAARFRAVESLRLPSLRERTLVEGLALTACGWALLGLSLWAALQAILPEPGALTASTWAQYTAMVALAYVAGFLTLFMPGGVGVREVLLQVLLTPELAARHINAPEGVAAAAVLLLRLVWTAAELGLAALIYCFPGPKLQPVQGAEGKTGSD
jgi:hypothetical protein